MGVHSPAIALAATTGSAFTDKLTTVGWLRAPEDGGYAPLASIAHEIGRELQSDGLLITWCEDERVPVRLYAAGACKPNSDIERDMLAMALAALETSHSGPRSQWRVRGEDGSGGMLTTSIPTQGSVVTVTSVFKRVVASTRMQASEAAARLLPLISPFFCIWTMQMKGVARIDGLSAALHKSDIATLLVGVDGEIVFANTAAEHLLSQRGGLRRKRGAVVASDFADTLRLHAAIERVVSPNTPRSATNPLVALKRASGRSLMASVVATELSGSGGAAAVIYVVDPDRDLRAPLEPACELYELSPVEARLTCLLANGLSLCEAAKELRVRELTARGYLKQIFLKTGTNRQVELVRLMLASAVHHSGELAPDAPSFGGYGFPNLGAGKA